MTAHHSVLIFEVLETATLPQWDDEEEIAPDAHELVQELYGIWDTLNQNKMLEAWHDAQQIREEALDLFSHGIVDLKTRAQIERLYWSITREINQIAGGLKHAPDEFRGLSKLLADKYFCNFSLFQSLPDSWAIDQIFPIMPIQRLDEKPDRSATLQDITCDSDGKIDDLDLTRSAYPVELGTRHPLSIVRNEIIDIFARLGFNIAEGPEIEDDWHVFSALNFAEDHPARDMQDTFFIESHPDVLLRTHTSSVQSRVMEVSQPPIRIICPGRVYRNEAISYRAHCFFHQVEALYVDRDVSFTDLKQVLLLFAKEMFGADTKIRLRPSYFPFTEPQFRRNGYQL